MACLQKIVLLLRCPDLHRPLRDLVQEPVVASLLGIPLRLLRAQEAGLPVAALVGEVLPLHQLLDPAVMLLPAACLRGSLGCLPSLGRPLYEADAHWHSPIS